MNKSVLARGIQAVGILFSAFGGFLTGLAPPGEADAKFAVGVSSFTALLVLFFCAALSRKQAREKHRRLWLGFAVVSVVVFLGSAFLYRASYNRLTWEYPPGNPKAEHIAGARLTTAAQQFLSENPGLSKAQLVAKFGGVENKEMVWPAESLNRSRITLVGGYVVIILALSCAIFSLTEGLLTRRKQAGSGK